MAVLQPQKVIHDSSHLWPMRSENKFLRILSLGPPTRSQPFAEAIWRYYPGLLTIRKLASQTASGKLHSLVQIVGDSYKEKRTQPDLS